MCVCVCVCNALYLVTCTCPRFASPTHIHTHTHPQIFPSHPSLSISTPGADHYLQARVCLMSSPQWLLNAIGLKEPRERAI